MRFHSFIQDSEGWTTLKTDELFANPFAEVHRLTVQTPTRRKGVTWTLVHRKGACVVAPVTATGNLLLVRQERIPIRATIWEFPAGQVDESGGHNGEVLRETALRELREESGYELAPGGELIPMGHFFPSAGIMDEHSHLFIARPVVRGSRGSAPDENEAITECREFTPSEFRAMIASGEIRDANTLAAFARMCALGFMQGVIRDGVPF
jgi:ADP-ribose pyrophosphatase